jgi:hypothetical protein
MRSTGRVQGDPRKGRKRLRPSYEIAITEPSIAAAVESLAHQGVPGALFEGRFTARDSVEALTPTLLRFGTTGIDDPVCLDTLTGKVVQVVVGTDETVLVNTSLERFVETAERVLELWPYYGPNATLADRMKVGDDLAAVIRAIDPAAYGPDQFWPTFVDDVVIGDFATELPMKAPR